MTEDYLQYVWKFGKFDLSDLKTTDLEKIEILRKGIHNFDAGPDFLEAKIKISDTLWVGSVEIHLKTSEWTNHKHHIDDSYNNVILHVVFENDKVILNNNGEDIPVLELKNLIDASAWEHYQNFLKNGNQLPCDNLVNDVPSLIINSTLDSMLLERLERKSNEILHSLKVNHGDWEETFHQYLFKYMGMKVNAEPMFELSRKLPYKLLIKEKSNRDSLEALIFGQAGFLNDELENNLYHQRLRSEYLYLKQKYSLSSMPPVVWKFSKMRPPNFPTMRMAQIAGLYFEMNQLFHLVREKVAIELIKKSLESSVSEFWKEHYTFQGDKQQSYSGNIGKTTFYSLLINWIAPFAFAYGRSIGDSTFDNYTETLLDFIPFEKNNLTKQYSSKVFMSKTAKDSQSLIQLNTMYCQHKKCLNCKIGVYLMK